MRSPPSTRSMLSSPGIPFRSTSTRGRILPSFMSTSRSVPPAKGRAPPSARASSPTASSTEVGRASSKGRNRLTGAAP